MPGRLSGNTRETSGLATEPAPELRRRRPSREAALLKRLDARVWPHVSRSYQGLDLSFAVRTTNGDTAAYLDRVLAPLAGDGPPAHLYSIVNHGERFSTPISVYYGGQRIERVPTEALAVGYLLWHLNRAVVAESSRYLLIHASAAAAGDGAILFPAASEAGKTTLIAGLLQRGFAYVTDEAVAIEPATATVFPFPKALAIEPGSWEVLSELRPAPEPRFDPYRVAQWHVVAEAAGSAAVSGPCRPRLVITPKYLAGAATTLEPVSRANGLMMLAENTFNFGAHRKTALHDLAAVVRECECFRLTYGSLSEACDVVSTLAARLGVTV